MPIVHTNGLQLPALTHRIPQHHDNLIERSCPGQHTRALIAFLPDIDAHALSSGLGEEHASSSTSKRHGSPTFSLPWPKSIVSRWHE